MVRQRKAGALPARTLVSWVKGAFEPLQKDLGRYLRKGRGLRLKNLATLGLAAEASGLSVRVEGGRLILTREDGELVSSTLGAQTVAPAESSPPPTTVSLTEAAAPEVANFMTQFMDQEAGEPAEG